MGFLFKNNLDDSNPIDINLIDQIDLFTIELLDFNIEKFYNYI